MKKTTVVLLALGLGASSARAQTLQLRGSDSLLTFTNHLLDICEPNITSSEMVYKGGGSSLGEGEMEADRQQVAPMGRFIDTTSCTNSHTQVCATDGLDNDADGMTDEPGELCGVAQGCKVALDGIATFVDSNEANTCNTIRYSGSLTVQDLNGLSGLDDGAGGAVAATYDFTDWRDVLRIVYGGQHTHINHDMCAESPPSRSAISAQRCNSDVRRTLVSNWNDLFQESNCGAGDPDACLELKHAFRRDDVSVATDVVLELLALPAITNPTFCNGKEMEDEDPIRRDCAADVTQPANSDGRNGYEQVCNSVTLSGLGSKASGFQTPFGTFMNPGWRGGPTVNPPDANSADLGLVLPIILPPADPYQDITGCSTLGVGGAFRYAEMPIGGLTASHLRCPDGNARVGGQCQWPARIVSGVPRFGCINKKENVPGARTIANIDGRVYNLIPRNPDGTIQTVPRVDVIDFAGGQPEYQVQLHHAFYRMHATAVIPGGVPEVGSTGCRLPDAQGQIGCLVRASPCSIGFAGLAAAFADANKLLALRAPNPAGAELSIAPTEETVRRINDPAGAGCDAAGDYDIRYPLVRNKWFNAIKGFESLGDPDRDFDNIANAKRERDLARCACDRFYADQAAAAAGFVTLSALAPGECDVANDTEPVCAIAFRTCP